MLDLPGSEMAVVDNAVSQALSRSRWSRVPAWLSAAVHVEHARELLGTELAALVGESYERAYPDMVRVQQLTELEEVIEYSQADSICNGEAGQHSQAKISRLPPA